MRVASFACVASFSFALLSFVSLVPLIGCPAPPKQVGDVSSENAPSRNDETPKWEGAVSPEPPKPSAAGGSSGTSEAPARRSDQYDREGTEVVLKRAARQAKDNCGAAKGDDGKASGPWGKLTVQVQLGSNGHSKGITVPSPFQGKPSGNCVEKAFASLTYPPWGGADAQVDWEVELVQPRDTHKK